MKFGDNLQNLRKQKKMSQEELAEKVDVSRQSISKWERGESYPTMNNIMILCNIFHCNINDLVHNSLADIDSLDEEIKMNVVKFKEEKQRKVKLISRIIYFIARIWEIIVILGITLLLFAMIFIPIISNNIKLSDETIELFGKNYNYEINNNVIILGGNKIETETVTDIEKYITSHSKIYHIFSIEFIIICMIATLIINYMMFKYLERLFINIYNENTPFTLENVKYIKKIALLLVISVLLPNLTGMLFEMLMKVDMGIEFEEVSKLIISLIIFSIAYIFEYGYEIQLDSNGRMYGNE